MSLPTFFGEIGGVNSFFVSLIAVLISGYQAQAFLFDQMKNLFRVNLSVTKQEF